MQRQGFIPKQVWVSSVGSHCFTMHALNWTELVNWLTGPLVHFRDEKKGL